VTLAYHVKLEADDNGTLLVTCASLPEVTTFGKNKADAMRHARNAIEEAIAARTVKGQDIPDGSTRGSHLVRLRARTSLKVDRYRRNGGKGRTLSTPKS
jgi:antitoxin HicB